MTCRRCEHGTANKFGYFGKRRIQRWRCTSCKATFCDTQPANPLGTMRTELDAAVRAVQCLLEGCSIRSTERLTGINRNTIMRLLVLAGERSAVLMDAKMRQLPCRRIQCDEIWTYCVKKQRRVRKGESTDIGDQWVFVAMDADTKLIPTFTIGKRTIYNTSNVLLGLVQATRGENPAYDRWLPLSTLRLFLSASGWMWTLLNLSKCLVILDSTTARSEVLPTKNHGGYIQSANWQS